MATRSVLGLFKDAESAAAAVEKLQQDGFSPEEYDVLTGAPYPEGAFGEHHPKHRLFFFPLVGAAVGFSVGLLLTAGTQLAYPLVTGGKPILAIPAMVVVMYEGTMLGAILFTVLGILFESRLPRLVMGVYDERITEGYIGVVVTTAEERLKAAEKHLRDAEAVEIKRQELGPAPTRGGL